MTHLEENVRHYMDLKGIRMYTHLLQAIAHQLGIRGQAAYDFVGREKANFTKMMKGSRPLKYEFIIPLEKIFGVSLARLMDEDAYKLPVEKDNVPFDKGFRYYAYLDNMELYKKELALMLNDDAKDAICGYDEFGKTFMDYLAEYGSVNGIRFLHDVYHIKVKGPFNQFASDPELMFWVNSDTALKPFARLVASMNDADLFYDIFDFYSAYLGHGPLVRGRLFLSDDLLEVILDHPHLFERMMERHEYHYVLGPKDRKKEGAIERVVNIINPIFNIVLDHSLRNLDKYKEQAKKMLVYGAEYNAEIICMYPDCYVADDEGEVYTRGSRHAVDIAITVHEKCNDTEISKLINAIPSIRR